MSNTVCDREATEVYSKAIGNTNNQRMSASKVWLTSKFLSLPLTVQPYIENIIEKMIHLQTQNA